MEYKMFVKALIFLLLGVFSLVSGKLFSEKTILLEFKNSVSDPSGILSSWQPNNSSHCSWFGISCDSESRVISVNITRDGVSKGNSKASFSCTKLARFPCYGVGKRRRSCLHGSGKLVGKLSPLVGSLSELRVLSLAFNGFSSEIPVEIWGLEKLEVLDVEGNMFNGRLPNVFEGLKKVQVLNLAFNRIDGVIPFSLRNSGSLEVLNLAGNMMRGAIPEFLGSYLKLKVLSLSHNELNGSIPSELGSNCRYLEYLDLSGNFLVGRIPDSLGKCQQLRTLLLFSNMLNEVVPRELGRLSKLEVLDVSQNRLHGLIPAELGHCVELSVLVLSDFLDPLPSDRNMRGELSIGRLSASNGDNNSFHGSIPMEITTLSKLRIVWAPRMNLEGKLPSSWGACESLEILNLAQNLLSGELIGVFDRCRKLCFVDLSWNKLQGYIPSSLHRLKYLRHLSLAGNNLTGSMPSSIDELRSLEVLELASNSLSGEIPEGVVNLTNLTTLLLNNNKLSGHIPSGLAYMTSLFTFNASYNNLSGSFQWNITAMNCSAVTGNLFFEPCQPYVSISSLEQTNNSETSNITPPTESRTEDHRIQIATIASASAIILVLLAVIVLFFYTRKGVPDSRVQVTESRELTLFVDIGVPLTYEGVVQATGNFNTSNCIGSGGFGTTYKAEISPGILVAVKRLAIGRFQHGVHQFHAEIKTLGNVRHPNLVTLIGYLASGNEMFLIYNYLSGGNLENFIEARSSKAVDWKILHKIALDIASALAYLHDQCSPRVLHRDVKPSNILLDDDFNAYLSDFGLSRLLGTSETHATTGVAGTFGYVAPEYAMTCRVSDKADVYSYGVVLLELISDKKALDPSFSSQRNGFNIISWAWMLLRQDQVNDAFNAEIWNSGPQDDLVEMLHLALRCTVETLPTRPTMKEVVQCLKQFQPHD